MLNLYNCFSFIVFYYNNNQFFIYITMEEGKITFDIVDRAKVTKADYIFKLIVLGDLGKFSLTIGKESERQS